MQHYYFDVLYFNELDYSFLMENLPTIKQIFESNIKNTTIHFNPILSEPPENYSEINSELYNWICTKPDTKYPCIIINDKSNAGLAGTGSIVSNKSRMIVGLSKNKNNQTYKFQHTFLHELGHTFGAKHDPESNSIMDNTGNTDMLYYTNKSKEEIEETIN